MFSVMFYLDWLQTINIHFNNALSFIVIKCDWLYKYYKTGSRVHSNSVLDMANVSGIKF